jgi:hypothetical protein
MLNQRSAVSLLVLAASLVAQERDDERKARPDPLAAAWQQALERAKAQKAPILAFVLPPADAKAPADRVKATWLREREIGMPHVFLSKEPPTLSARELLLRHIQLLRLPEFRRRSHVVQATPSMALLALSIPVVAAAELCGAKPGETAVLLGPDGKRMEGFALDLLEEEAFVKQLGGRLLDRTVLAARAANVPPELARDVAALPVKREQIFLEDHALEERLRMSLAAAAPLLVKVGTDGLELHPVLWLLDELRPPLGTEKPGLPYEMCTGCGMGFTPQAFYNVLQLIGP